MTGEELAKLLEDCLHHKDCVDTCFPYNCYDCCSPGKILLQ